MPAFGLSLTVGFGRSLTGDSDYRKPGPLVIRWNHWRIRPSSNCANKESFGLLLTAGPLVDGRTS